MYISQCLYLYTNTYYHFALVLTALIENMFYSFEMIMQ